MKTPSKNLDNLANIAVIILAVVLTVVLVQKFYFGSSNVPQRIKAGDKISIAGLDFNQNEKTILIALQPNCRFCAESADFYKTLQESVSSKGGFHSIALFSPEIQNEKEYLQTLNVKFDEIKKVSFETLKIQATPTTLIINKEGKVESVWNGKLSPQREDEFFSQLK
ncbi:hypothetical protein BH20ACI1_BH20ACI1_16490 [soil metagenome]